MKVSVGGGDPPALKPAVFLPTSVIHQEESSNGLVDHFRKSCRASGPQSIFF